MAFKPLPSREDLRQLLDYDPASGVLTWRQRPREMFQSAMQWRRWNDYYAGGEAGRINSNGYRIIKVRGEGYTAHRIIWKMATGLEPGEIDHINREKSDNRIENLRDVTRSENMRNKGLTALNTSGEKHISWSKGLGCWVIQLIVPGKGQRQVGYSKTLADAVAKRDKLYGVYGYERPERPRAG